MTNMLSGCEKLKITNNYSLYTNKVSKLNNI